MHTVHLPIRAEVAIMDGAANVYFLARHAHVCVLRERMVLLDLVSGKYLALDAPSARSLHKYVRGWPQFECSDENDAALGLLLKRQLITKDPAFGKLAHPVRARGPGAWIGELHAPGCPKLGVQHIWRFFRASTIAAASLRALRLQSVLRRVGQRKSACRSQAAMPLDEISELVRIFNWLRPLAFDKKDQCVLYCLALTEFLASYSVFPDWIFGVQDRPFRAHCWLQHEEHLLTDIPFLVRELTPIMVV